MATNTGQVITRPVQELLGHHAGYGFAGFGVSTAIGNFTQTVLDLSFPAGLLGLLDWSRTYNSRSQAAGILGPGWATSFTASLQPSQQGLLHHTAGPVLFHDVDGRTLTFTPDPAGGFERPQDLDADLTKNADGSFTLAFNSGETWAFDSNGRFTGKSLEGQSLTVTYDGAGLPQRVTHSSGRHLVLSYDSQGHLAEAESDDGRAVFYGYDGSGLLDSVTGPAGGITRYTSSDGQLTQVTDADGNLVVTNVYGGDPQHRITSQVLAGGRTASLDFNDSSGVTLVTNQSGARMTFQADSSGRLASATDPAGNTATFRYDANGYLSEAVSPGGVRLTQTRDPRGNLLTSTFGGATVACAYDSLDRPTSLTNPVGDTATYTYSGTSRIPSAVTAPGGATSQLTSAGGQVTSATDADGNTTSYGFDAVGNLNSIKDPAANTFQFGHDSAGNPTSFVTPAGATSLFSYDGLGRLVSATDATGAVTQVGYSAAGYLTQVTDPTGAATVNGYDDAGNLTSITDPLGRQTTFGYDADGNQTSATSPAGLTTVLAYDGSGRLSSVTDAAGGTTAYGYDADGNQVTETDALGRVTRRTFDSRGNVTSVTDAAGNTSSTEYDLNDRPVKLTNADGNTWQVSYDSLGHSVTGTDPAGDTSTAQWTPGGRLSSTADQLGRKTSYTYDTGGQLAQATDASGGTSHYEYDSSGRITSITTPAGLVTSFRYDQAGKLIAAVDPRGWITSYVYDERGQRIAVTTPSGAVTRYQYDAAGQLTTLTDPNDGVTSYRYDNAGRLIVVTDPKAATTQYAYDDAGRLTSVTDPLGRVTQRQYDKSGSVTAIIGPDGRAQQFTYDNAGRVISRSADDAATVSYTYDKAGQRTSMTDATGTTHYAYDSNGRLTTVTDPDGAATTASYDAAGQRTSLSYPSGLRLSYGYDGNGRLISLQDSRAGQALYALDPDGRLLTEQLPWRLARRYHYDFGLLSRFEAIREGHEVAVASFAYDPDGRIISQRDRDQVQEYRYDGVGQLILAAREPAAPPPGPHRERAELRLAYDAAGNRSSLRHGGTEVHYRYDEADQLLHSESRGHRISYRYDPAGRLIEEANGDRRRSVTYDGFGQPAEIARTGPGEHEKIRAVFNGDGLLASLTLTDDNARRDEEHQARVQYRWGSFDLIPQIIAQQARPDLDDSSHDRPGRLDADFAYGYGRTFANWAQGAAAFHSDALGSMISTEDTRPWVREHAYGAFGTAAASAAPDGQDRRRPQLPTFGYRGELGLGGRLYLRARTYDPEIGRFTTPDPASASSVPTPGQPSNPYVYADSDPLDRTDPRGLLAIPIGGGAGPDTASLTRDAIGGIFGGAANAASRAVQDVADMFTSVVSAHKNTVKPKLPPGWPGLLSPHLAHEFGSPPTCTGPKRTWSEACLQPLTPFASRGATWSGRLLDAELQTLGAYGALARAGIAGLLLAGWLDASGQPLELSASWLQSLYQVPSVQRAINRTARCKLPCWARAELARGQVVPPIHIAIPRSGLLAWSTAISTDPKQGNFNTLVESTMQAVSSQCANQLDWFLALATFDYRLWSWDLNGTKITFSFEISKYYDQSKPILGFSPQQLEALVAEGLARNYWIVGISKDITIPAVG